MTWAELAVEAAKTRAGSENPKWTDVAAVVINALTLGAVIVGAAIGYLRFARSRKMHSRCSLTVTAKPVQVADRRGLLVTLRVTNDGTYRLLFEAQTDQPLQVAYADRAMLRDAERGSGLVAWHTRIFHQQDVLEAPPEPKVDLCLEPGQGLVREILVPLPDVQALAYRVQVGVNACPMLIWALRDELPWSTETIIPSEVT